MIALYRLLLHLYPKAFREEYGREMETAFRHRWHQHPGLGLALSTIVDAVATALTVHRELTAQDLRFAARSLRQQPGFALSVTLTLALGIGATTAMFSLVYAVLLRPSPLREPERIVRIFDVNRQLRIGTFASSEQNFRSWRERARSFSAMAAFRTTELNVMNGSLPERVTGLAIQGDFWRTMGLRPLAGREFTEGEHKEGNHRVVLLGEGLWRRSFGADPSLIGRAIQLSGEAYTVIGVAPSYVGFANGMEIIVPMPDDPGERNRNDRRVGVAARLAPGVTGARALAEMTQICEQLERDYPAANRGWRVRLASVQDWFIEPAMRRSLWVLLSAVGLLLMLACANVANLLLARTTARQREIGVRLALGASRARLARQVVTESLFLGALGGAAGLALAFALLRAFLPFLPPDLISVEPPRLDATALLFALVATLSSSLLFGSAPAFLFARRDVRQALAGGRGAALGESTWLRRLLAAGQVALASVLLIGGLLLMASFTRMLAVDLGVQPERLLLARFNPAPARITNGSQAHTYYTGLLNEIRALPGVVSAGITSEVPLGPVATQMPSLPSERAELVRTEGVQAQWRIVTDGYLETLGIRLLRGRFWSANETGSQLPIVISDSLRRRFWRTGEDPLGRTIRLGNGRDYRVVGVASDVKQLSLLDGNPTHTIYLPAWFTSWPMMNIAIRTSSPDPAALATALRQAVRRVDPGQPLYDVRTMNTFLHQVTANPRVAAWLLSAFALLAVFLAAIGVAGLVAYAVSRRRAEMAVRLALGATPGRVVREVTFDHWRICIAGLALGMAITWLLRPVVASLLFGVDPGDPAVYAIAALTLLGAGLLACWLPARRAARISPSVALRTD